ncbi:MAG TPA: S9 family peptidase [Candidatus Eremiobacteraceae bacterium]|nr:S9 family peptidase [Candidatus Eremiobacteraceae bacterium]
MRQKLAVSACAVLVTCAVALPAAARTITLADLSQIVGVSDAQISPDGTKVAVVTTTSDFEKNARDSEVRLIDVRSGTVRQLTYGRDDASSPRWSPDGTRLAFIANHGSGDDAEDQVWVLSFAGGDPVAVTQAQNGVDEFAWRPDGKAIAFVADDSAAANAANPALDAYEVGDNDYLARRVPASSQLWMVSAAGGPARKLTSQSWQLSQLSWAPNGRTIAAAAQRSLYTGDADQSAIVTIDASTGAFRGLTGRQRLEYGPLYSPDGATIAYSYTPGGTVADETRVYLSAANGMGFADVDVSAPVDRELSPVAWMPDGRSILASSDDDLTSSLWSLSAAYPEAAKVPLGDVAFFGGTVSRTGAIAIVGGEPQRPAEVYYLASKRATPRRLTDFNGRIAALDLGAVQPFAWTNEGYHEDGVVTLPPGADLRKRYPLVVLIHGGPTGASLTNFDTGYGGLAQLFAARGDVVFEPNYRGSDNLGARYQQATIGDLGAGPGRDIVVGVKALEARGFVDPARIAVGGWSEGGCLTSWLITHYDLWRAAMAGAAVTDWIAEYNLSDALYYERAIAGPAGPWVGDGWAEYAQESSIGAASFVKAPTLIMSDTGDYRVPTPEEYAFYHALKDNGVTVRYVAFPVHAHYPSDPDTGEAIERRWLAWFDTYLR